MFSGCLNMPHEFHVGQFTVTRHTQHMAYTCTCLYTYVHRRDFYYWFVSTLVCKIESFKFGASYQKIIIIIIMCYVRIFLELY